MTTDSRPARNTKPRHLVGHIARMEIRRYLVTPGFWVLGALLQAGLAWQFFIHLDRFMDLQPRLADRPDAAGVTDLVAMPTLLDAAALLLLIAPLLSMRSLSEERKSGSLILLQAAPVSDLQLLLGKLFGLVTVLTVPIALAVAMTASLAAGTSIDLIRIATGSVGLLLTILVTAAGGLWISGTTRHPPIAAALLYALFLFLWMAQLAESPTSLDINLVQWIALPTHLEPLLEGRLRTGDIVYFLVLTAGFTALGWLNLVRLRGGRA